MPTRFSQEGKGIIQCKKRIYKRQRLGEGFGEKIHKKGIKGNLDKYAGAL